jgi:putative endonuclease
MGELVSGRILLGRWGEALAAEYLESKGYLIIARNLRTPYGEIDLIAIHEQPSVLLFIEVKTRRSKQFGPPEEAVNLRKLKHLRSSVEYYLQGHPEIAGDPRLDVIAIQRYQDDQPPAIVHFENVLS